MSGFGSQPYGTSPYGWGTPAVAAELGGSILRDEVTGETHGSRYIDPATKDYRRDAYGRIVGMSNTKQLVLLAVSTDKGSSAMRQLGQELRKIPRISSNFERRVDVTIRTALQHIVDRGLIEVLEVTTKVVRPAVAFARVRWRETATGVEDFTDI